MPRRQLPWLENSWNTTLLEPTLKGNSWIIDLSQGLISLVDVQLDPEEVDHLMAVRDMIVIDEEKCNGCGLCVPACAEGALQIIDGKARLLRDDFCDGLGACLGHCPQGALSIEKREAPEFDEEAAMAHARRLASQQPAPQQPAQESGVHMGCPGARMMELTPASCACWTKGRKAERRWRRSHRL